VHAVINKPSEVERRIDDLKAAELAIENKATHQGYRDASRRNRIEEEVEALDEIQRRDESGAEILRVRCCNGTERCCGYRTRTGPQSLLRAKVLSLKNSLLEDWTRIQGAGRLFGR